MKEAPPPPPYAFEDDVEMAVVLAACGEPRFYQAIGAAIDPRRLRDKRAQTLLAAAHAVASKTGRPPAWSSIPVQHLATLMSRGKVTLDQLNGAKDYLLEAYALPTVHVDDLIAAVVPLVQRVHHKDALVKALDGYKNNASPADAAATFDAVAKLGAVASNAASTIEAIVADPDFFSVVHTDMLRFGIPELDDALGGGLERKALGLIVGGTGAGKSMALAHVAVESILGGHQVLYVTLELSQVRVAQRIVRNLIDMTKREAQIDPNLARARFAKVMGISGMGRFVVKEAPALVTSPRDIRVIADQAMRDHPGFDPDVFVVDFLDKLRFNQKASLYDDMLAVTDGLRSVATDANGWMWTAAQSDRKSTGRPWLDLDAVADSMNKVRSADLVIAIGRTEEDQTEGQVRFSVPKRREGEGAHTRIGPVPWDPERGRISVVSDRSYPW